MSGFVATVKDMVWAQRQDSWQHIRTAGHMENLASLVNAIFPYSLYGFLIMSYKKHTENNDFRFDLPPWMYIM